MSDIDLKQFFLEQVPLFSSFSAEKIEEILTRSRLATFEGNEAMLETGDETQHFGVMISGHAEVSTSDNTGSRHVVAQLGPGDVFGVMALLTAEKIAADVIAGNRCFVLLVPQTVFASHILANPKAVAYLSRQLAERTRAMTASEKAEQLGGSGLLALHSAQAGKVVALNVGLQQIHFGIYDTRESGADILGVVEAADTPAAHLTVRVGPQQKTLQCSEFRLSGLFAAITEATALLGQAFTFHPADVVAIGHRVVHGGNRFASAVVITPEVIADIETLATFAPLHNPANIAGIRAAQKAFPNVPQVAVFDTAFHQTLAPYAYLYGLPYELYKQHGIRRYGFHGLSYEYIAQALSETAPEIAEGRVIVAHLGSGASMCALQGGRSVETTMGFTALDGLPMGTRPGQLDPGVVLHLIEEKGMTPAEITRLLYREAGLKGLSGISSDMRDLLTSPDPRAALAIEHFAYRCGLHAGQLAAALGGLDAFVFTAGIGEHSPEIRARIAARLAWLGAEIDPAANAAGATCISTPASRLPILVIPTDEERMIARHTFALTSGTT